MYEVYYNLRAEPFRLSPDHNFCYEHKGYAKARAYMAYAFKRAEGFVMITGRPGTGKTTLIGELVESLSSDRVATANLVCTQLQADDLLRSVAYSFGIGSSEAGKADLLQRLTVLLNRWQREERRALLIVDEAQDLSASAMEELRLLTNIQTAGQPLLQIFLLGQPELRDLILSREMEQVHQRIVAASHLEGLGPDEVEAYVLHRLQRVGWSGDPALNRAIFPIIHKYSEGVPRRINLICSRLFLLGSVEERHAIDLDDVRVVISELQAESLAAGSSSSPEDFTPQGEVQWLTGPEDESLEQARPEVRLRAVNSEVDVPLAEPPETTAAPKKKAPPPVTAVPLVTTGSEPVISAELDAGAVDTDPEPRHQDTDRVSGVVGPDDAAQVLPVQDIPAPPPRSMQVPPGSPVQATGAEFTRTTMRQRPEAKPSRWRRVLVAATLVVLMVVAFLFWQIYDGSQGRRDYLEAEVMEPVATANDDLSLDDLPDIGPLPSEQWDIDGPAAVEREAGEAEDAAPTVQPVSVQNAEAAADMPGRSVGLRGGMELAAPESAPGIEANRAADRVIAAAGSASIDVDGQASLEVDSQASISENEEERLLDLVSSEFSEQEFTVRFDFDSDELLPAARVILDEVAASLRVRPDTLASIIGFADYRGDELYNLELSRKRAIAVTQYLAAAGVEVERLHAQGRGSLAGPQDQRVEENAGRMEQYRVVQIVLGDKN